MNSSNILIPGLADFIESDVPIENPDSLIPLATDENGNPIPDQSKERSEEAEDTGIHIDINNPGSFKGKMTGKIPSLDYNQIQKPNPTYCPVYVTALENGGNLFQAYISGQIKDVDCYLDLIDTLYTATERDIYIVYIDSVGGLIASGGIISSMIDQCKAQVYTVARGLAASSGALIHSSAKPGFSKVSEFAVMMYHMSSHSDLGVSTQIANRAKNQVEYVNRCLLIKALEEGHLTQEEFNKIQNGEEIFVTAAEFNRRTAAKQAQEGVANG